MTIDLARETGHRREVPDDLVQAIERDAGVQFIGNYPQSGTKIKVQAESAGGRVLHVKVN